MLYYKFVAALVTFALCAFANELERVDDNDLVHLLTGQEDVITLFTKKNCPDCVEYDRVISNMQKELKESFGAVVVKAHESNLVGIYDPSREPALLYFRRGIPLLYYGDINEDEIIEFFNDNREPVVKELSDENFEHLTQASTGATTGDWFLFFYSADCVFCQRLYAVWESVGAKLKRKLTVARINRLEAGISTAKRLGVLESPAFIFLRQGNIYRYNIKDYSPKSFIEFAEGGYLKQTHPDKVPPPKGLMDDVSINLIKDYIASLELFQLAVIIIFVITIAFLITKCCSKKSNGKNSKTKKTK